MTTRAPPFSTLTAVRQRVREKGAAAARLEPVPCGSGHGLGLASKIGLASQPDIRQAD